MALYTSISESKLFREILKHIHFDTVVLCDLDNTVMEAKCELGSDQWFGALLKEAFANFPEEKEKSLIAALAIYNAIESIVKTQVIEDTTSKIINALQAIGLPVIAITSRGKMLQEATEGQLESCGIKFSHSQNLPKDNITLEDGDDAPFYANGIIYCSGQNKGKCFSKFCEMTEIKPVNIAMIDDKKKHLEEVSEVTRTKFSGVRYGFLDTKVANFNYGNSLEQLGAIKEFLPEDVQNYIDKIMICPKPKNPDRFFQFFNLSEARTTETTYEASIKF